MIDKPMLDLVNEKKIFTVSDLNKEVKKLLENHFQVIFVEGEVSNLSRPSSGHIYFTLKDETAQVRCAMFRTRHSNFAQPIENGMNILACAKISLYDARGDYQLIVEFIEERGEGLLRRQFELLKKNLAAQGLFDVIHKKPIPNYPKRIGIITSHTGAAIKDVLAVLQRRFAGIPIIIYPTLVQGELAPAKIKQALLLANQRSECDVIILCRGGGSLEDLFAFNHEEVARAIFASHIPIVSGIGHEVDVTIADFVADLRAATPSAAAELISPDKSELLQHVNYFQQRIVSLMKALVMLQSQALDMLEQQLMRSIKIKVEHTIATLDMIRVKICHFNPVNQLKDKRANVQNFRRTLILLMKQKLESSKQKILTQTQMLNAVSPLQTLERGYSITTKDNHVVDDIDNIALQDNIKIELKNGFLMCLVEDVKAK